MRFIRDDRSASFRGPGEPQRLANRRRRATLYAALFTVAVLISPDGWARHGSVVVNWGEELFEVGPFPADLTHQITRDNNAGFRCSHVGIFWADIWTWNCHLIAISPEERDFDLPEAVVAKLSGNPEFTMENAKRGLWNHFGFWSIAVLVAIGAITTRNM